MTDKSEGKGSPDPSVPIPVAEAELVEVGVRRVLEKETKLQARELDRVTHQIASIAISTWRAPLPPPAILREYNDIVPGCAGEIITTFTGQVAHRQSMERKGLIVTSVGMVFGFLGLLAMLGVAGYALLLGFPWVAGTIATVLTGVVGLFVFKQRSAAEAKPSRQANRAERRRAAARG